MFGVLLSQQELGSDGIPHLVAKCLQFVETYSMCNSYSLRGILKGALSGILTDFRTAKIYICGVRNTKIMAILITIAILEH